jgi:hypothetical protein
MRRAAGKIPVVVTELPHHVTTAPATGRSDSLSSVTP